MAVGSVVLMVVLMVDLTGAQLVDKTDLLLAAQKVARSAA